MPFIVRGTLNLLPKQSFEAATAFVRVRDIAVLDVAAPLLAERMIGTVDGRAGAMLSLPFSLAVPSPAGSHGLEAHLSLSGSREIKAGDYITVQSYTLDQSTKEISIGLELKQV